MSYGALIAALPYKVYAPDTTEYKDCKRSYYTPWAGGLSPDLVVRPKSAGDVSIILQEARKADIKLAIKGRGYTPFAGAANISGGVTVDTREILGVTVSENGTMVSIGAGETWMNVLQTLESKGLATLSGRVPRIGVTGFVLGGGMSYFFGRYGFACDAARAFEVVLSSGDIVEASATSNPDLFAAIKGGGNNFGFITRIDLPAFQQGPMWGGMTFHPGDALPQLVRALEDYTNQPDGDENVNILVSYGWSSQFKAVMSAASLYHTDPRDDEQSPATLANFTSIEPKVHSSSRLDSVLGFATEQGSHSSENQRVIYITTSMRADAELLLQVRDVFLQAVEPIKDVENLTYPWVIQPITARALDQSSQGGPNAMGLSSDDGSFVLCEFNPTWTNPADDERVRQTLTDMVARIDQLAEAEGKGVRWRFLNYADQTQNPIESYGQQRLDFLRGVSRKYDPSGFFQKNVPGGFKLGME